jgi:hypothetical protein
VGETCPPLDLSILDQQFADAVPLEYKALASAGSKLMRDRLRLYIGDIDVIPTEHQATARKISLSIVDGALAAFAPHISIIKKGVAWNGELKKDIVMLGL